VTRGPTVGRSLPTPSIGAPFPRRARQDAQRHAPDAEIESEELGTVSEVSYSEPEDSKAFDGWKTPPAEARLARSSRGPKPCVHCSKLEMSPTRFEASILVWGMAAVLAGKLPRLAPARSPRVRF
jgi:hypothetical protein